MTDKSPTSATAGPRSAGKVGRESAEKAASTRGALRRALRPVRAFLRLVAIEHSVFALPFAYLSALSAMRVTSGRINWADLALITVAMVGARTFAMAANRIIDRHIDARNPRTAGRELVTGAVSLRTARMGAAVALVCFLAAAAALNPLVAALAPLAVVPLVVYPYAKRFTDWPHAVLATAQMVAPVGAWLAVTGTLAGSGPAFALGAAVGLWIGGFDLIYACQDAEVDRRIGVRSVPARYGVRFALRAAVVAHAATFGLFVWYGHLVGLRALWWVGLVVTAGAFAYEHSIVRPHDLSRVNRAFFTVNGVVGIVRFAFAVGDLLVTGGLR